MVIPLFTRGDTVSVAFDRITLPSGERFTPLDSDLTVILKGPSALTHKVAKEGAFWKVSIGSNETDALLPGRYAVYLRFTSGEDGGESVKTFAYGATEVFQKPEDLGDSHDPRSRAEKALEEAEQALMNFKSGKRVQSYSIDGRSMTFTSTADILSIVRYWRARVEAERSGDRWRKVRRVSFQ